MLPSILSENLFDDFFNSGFGVVPSWKSQDGRYANGAKNLMKVDVKETNDSYKAEIELPGYKKEDIKVDMKDGYLTVSASMSSENKEEDQDGKYIRKERYTGACSRSFYVGDLEPEDISAKFEDGILKISMPKEVKKKLPEATAVTIE